MKVLIVRGISGAGKSTYIQEHYPEATVVSADQYFLQDGEYKFDPKKLPQAHQFCWRNFFEAVQKKAPFIVVDNTNLTVSEISPYVLPAEAFGYKAEIITILVDPVIAAARNVHGVSEGAVQNMQVRLTEAEKSFPAYWRHEKISLE